MSINVIGSPHRRRLFFVALAEVVSSTLQTLLACYDLFRAVPLFTSHKVAECFGLQIYYKSTPCRFYYKDVQALLCSGTALSKAGIIKWGRYYKAGKHFLQSGVIITKEVLHRRQLRQTGDGNRFWELTPILTPELL